VYLLAPKSVEARENIFQPMGQAHSEFANASLGYYWVAMSSATRPMATKCMFYANCQIKKKLSAFQRKVALDDVFGTNNRMMIATCPVRRCSVISRGRFKARRGENMLTRES
jgi:hypothetical protein